MATKKFVPPPVGAPTVDSPTAIARIHAQIDKARALLAGSDLSHEDFKGWELVTKNVLEAAFGANHDNVLAVENRGAEQTSYGWVGAPPSHYEQGRRKGMSAMVVSMEGLIEVLEATAQPGAVQPTRPTAGTKSVFLVHGHDERRHQVENFLAKFHLKVIVLADQPSRGNTIIEKLEASSDCAFAVVLLTGDDVGGLKGTQADQLHARARQNVILELGYFMGRLGRKKVCALYDHGVEIPSDYAGVVFVEFDAAGAWRLKLAMELDAAGLEVDMNMLKK